MDYLTILLVLNWLSKLKVQYFQGSNSSATASSFTSDSSMDPSFSSFSLSIDTIFFSLLITCTQEGETTRRQDTRAAPWQLLQLFYNMKKNYKRFLRQCYLTYFKTKDSRSWLCSAHSDSMKKY